MDPMDLVNGLNEHADMEKPVIDKKQVYRWLDGQWPNDEARLRIANVLDLRDLETGDPDPDLLLTHPAQDWMARRLKGQPPEEVERLKELFDLALPRKTGS